MRGAARGTSASVFFLILGIFVLASCGGDGDSASAPAITYAGLTTEASITDSNADEISSTSLQGSGPGTLGGVASLSSGASNKQSGHQLYLVVSRLLEEMVRNNEASSSAGDARAIYSNTSYIPGNCPGSPGYAVFYENINTLDGSYYGTISFVSFCFDGYTYSGNASFSGQLDFYTASLQNLSFSLNNVVLTTPCGDSQTVAGDIFYDFSVVPALVEMTLLIKENGSSTVYRLEDLSMTFRDYDTYIEESITGGRFYHPDYGYITYSTQIPLRFYNGSDWPSNGVLVLTGADAGGGPTRARLTVLSDTQYRIEADTDGNGLYEYDSGPQTWETDACE
ncbi:MAG: hypothetical protein H3C68_03480 [Deltaproteobacteria bacterium]|nr:hypothetical protein [Deltaproteobacteria bacterium]MBZ0219787.1 hypothetical protein [Deltaproteobacteria bacterium]